MTPKEHIQEIRNSYTSENRIIDEETRKVIDNLSVISTNSILELATSIYKSDSHFMMELIQNADDNEYQKGLIPSLKIIQEENRLIVQNNEVGFKPKNVDSICNIKKSTKGIVDGEKGYIGEKGIGFKSVFRITDEPEIYSNGYQFKFTSLDLMKKRKRQEKLSFILPEWIDKPSINIEPKKTHIVLPFKKSLSEIEKNKLSDLRPDLPLFLNKISKIEIVDVEHDRITIYEKKKNNNYVTITTSVKEGGSKPEITKLNYYLIEKVVTPPKKINVAQRKNVKSAKIVLAFPLDNKSNFVFNKQQFIYSYLPIDKYGFNFIIQADFILTSGRESIDEDNPWNIWMRDEVINSFKYSIEQFKLNETFKYSFLNYLQFYNVSSDFWLNFVNEIHNYCLNKKVVFSEGGEWLKSENTLLADVKVRDLFDNDLLKSATKFQFLNSKCTIEKNILSILKIYTFNYVEILDCLKATAKINSKDDDWFVKLYTYIATDDELNDYISDLKSIPFIRIDSASKINKLVSPSKNIFLPFDGNTKYSFEKDFIIFSSLITEKLIQIKSKDTKNKIFNFFSKIGIDSHKPYTVIKKYILPKYLNNEWKKCKLDEIIDHLVYIKDNWKKLNSYHDEIIDLINNKPIIKTSIIKNGNYQFSTPEGIYISKFYGNVYGVEEMLNNIDDSYFIDDYYIKFNKTVKKMTDSELLKLKQEWFVFFKNIGCLIFPDCYAYNTRKHVELILEKGSIRQKTMILKLLENKWDHYSKYIKYDNWFNVLITKACIPVGKKLFQVKNLYKKDKSLQHFFGNNVIYYPRNISNKYAVEIKLNTYLNSSVIINYLINLSEKKMCLSIDNAKKIYNRLQLDTEADLSKFKNYNLIYLPSNKAWYNISNLFWGDFKLIFQNKFGYCSKDYPPILKDFFITKIGIKIEPDIHDYIYQLNYIKKNTITKGLIQNNEISIIHLIYSNLGTLAMSNTGDFDFENEMDGLIWTNHSTFWYNENDIFYNDNNQLFQLYSNEKTIAFIDLPSNILPKTKHLLSKLNIRGINESVQATLLNESFAVLDDKMTHRIRANFETLKSVIYSDYPLFFEKNKQSLVFDSLQNIEIYEMPEIELVYSLNDIEKTSKASSFHNKNCIYITRNTADKNLLISIEIASLIGLPEISQFILLLLTLSKTSIAYFLNQKNIVLPPDETIVNNENYIDYENSSTDNDSVDFIQNAEYIEEYSNAEEFSENLYEDHQNEYHEMAEKWEPLVDVKQTNIDIEQYKPDNENERTRTEGRTFSKDYFNNINNQGNSISKSLPQDLIDKIGDFGEEKVFVELIRQFKEKYNKPKYAFIPNKRIFQVMDNKQIILEIRWLNNTSTVQEGYDIIVTENEKVKYYEVKTTRGDETVRFNVSPQQWNFIASKKEAYSIVRVSNAGKSNIKITEINNPYKLWRDGKLNACPVSIEL